MKTYCSGCFADRHHEVLFKTEVPWEQELDVDYSLTGGSEYELIKCLGCHNVALKRRSWMDEEVDAQGQLIVKTSLYPPATFRPEPKWLAKLFWVMPQGNNFVREFLQEIYVALQHKSLRLAVMGIRALLEQIMVDKIGEQPTFGEHLKEFQAKGFVSPSQSGILESVIDAGNATIHRSFKPTIEEVGYLMDITEHVIEAIYINERSALQVAKRVPKRVKKPKEKKSKSAVPQPTQSVDNRHSPRTRK